jgi:hypothetical protein
LEHTNVGCEQNEENGAAYLRNGERKATTRVVVLRKTKHKQLWKNPDNGEKPHKDRRKRGVSRRSVEESFKKVRKYS